jgi:hypothetical protein
VDRAGELVRALCGLVCGAVFAAGASAQSLETAIMPGPVIEGHAKLEAECGNCHVRFKRTAQSGLCLDCHKDVARDVAKRAGYHGRQAKKECRACHTDHKGREARIAAFNHGAFDHAVTDFALRGAHVPARLECAACHVAGKKFRDAPSACYACHAKDDKHKGSLGKACGDCHTEANWKKTRFDHAKTRFPLRNRHVDVACKSCHADPGFKGAPLACAACHAKDDRKKGHQGRFGDKCQSCHTDRGWKSTTFNHQRDTRYALRGQHAQVRCAACHTGMLYRDKLSTTCLACHKKDDAHKGQLGPKCESCHNETRWSTARVDHGLTRFPLLGKHAQVKCKDCHRTPQFKQAPTECYACHRQDDKHKLRLGTRCADCHQPRSWKQWEFDHQRRTSFPLTGKHRGLDCHACHRNPVHGRASLPVACVACHEDRDVHNGGFGRACERCHVTSSFSSIKSTASGRLFQ